MFSVSEIRLNLFNTAPITLIQIILRQSLLFDFNPKNHLIGKVGRLSPKIMFWICINKC